MTRIALFTLVSALMTGCGGGGSGDDPGKIEEGTPPDSGSSDGSDDNDNATPSDEITLLEGTWNKQCGPVKGEVHHDIVTITFTRGTFSTSIENYIDSGCMVPLPEAPNPTSSGYFTLGADVVLGSGITATELDSHVTRYNGADWEIDEYTIVYIENNILYTGEGDGESPAQRPTSLDYDRPFDRVN
ncbi:hypothetical protein [Marinobacter sp. AL4B]|uniref:hypothetical protein n=1 Tax=Marinobacter sp. AL4B TaxID=2871173 RepID=UPI001CAA7E1A|nr:hypothetical protein [Marinobacter sp. AL4B]MBZ0334602.1 hypothetical protein [Marinobacter sp. AL4B]